MVQCHTSCQMKQSSVLVLLSVCAACGAQESRTVRTAQGEVRGHRRAGEPVYRFYGIPYATAPTGARRFTAPLPGPMWTQPLDAVRDRIICPQPSTYLMDTSKYDMREDCLVANVFVPDTSDTKLPVLVQMHGGAYIKGFADLFPIIKLVETKKIIAVSFNYRLGAHGFLCLGTELAPGNAGMKDAVALLRWVRTNIASFGGNPDDVTIDGYSAGASAVELLMLSKMTAGLYNKVILESGTSVATWGVQLDPLEFAKKFARTRNFTNVNDIDALGEFYATSPFETFYVTDGYREPDNRIENFAPCIERDIGREMFLDDAPVNILKQGKYRNVPVLIGSGNMEGLIITANYEQWKNRINERFSDFLPADLQFEDYKEKQMVAQTVKQFYFGDKLISKETIQGYIDYFSDVAFVYPQLRSVRLQVEAGSNSIYLYEYTFVTPLTTKHPKFVQNANGTTHCAQTFAVLDIKNVYENVIDTEDYIKMKEILVKLWINFITTGKPVPEGSHFPTWPPVGADQTPYMELNLNLTLKGRLLEQRTRFWDAIYEKHYRPPAAAAPRQTAKVGNAATCDHTQLTFVYFILLAHTLCTCALYI